jgi:hypothetical protein
MGRLRGDPVFCYIKTMRSEECNLIEKSVKQVFLSRNSPEGMLLARARHEQPGFWYVMWLSAEKESAALHHNFTAVEPAYLPKAAILLLGHRKIFERYFTYESAPVPMKTSRR